MLYTSLDLLIIAVMVIAAVGLVALALMFLLRSPKARRVCLYMGAALGMYLGYVGLRINLHGFALQSALAVALALAAIAAVVLVIKRKDDEKMFRLARLMTALSVVVGMMNAFVW